MPASAPQLLARALSSAALLLSAAASAVTAAAPSASQLFAIRQQNSANSNNFATGDILYWGANSVSPDTSYAFTRQCPAGASCTSASDPDYVRQAIYHRPFTTTPSQYFASRPYDPKLTGAWSLVLSSDPSFPATSSGLTSVINTPAVGDVGLMPYVSSMSITGAGLTPTLSWTLPATTPVGIDQVRIRVFDNTHRITTTSRTPSFPNSFQQADSIFTSPLLAPSATGYALPAGLLAFNTEYSVAIALEHTRPDGSVDSRSQSYFDFTPLDLPGAPNVALPTFSPVPTTSGATAGPLYGFQVPNVGPDSVTFIDPLVASGFSYVKGASDPNFKSVTIASNVGDGLYDVYVQQGGQWVLAHSGLAANDAFEFGAGGVDRFEIRGIETAAAVDPFNVTAFVTGLSFVTDGSFTGTMQAIIVDTAAVPEATTLALWLAGLTACWGRWRRRQRHALSRAASA